MSIPSEGPEKGDEDGGGDSPTYQSGAERGFGLLVTVSGGMFVAAGLFAIAGGTAAALMFCSQPVEPKTPAVADSPA